MRLSTCIRRFFDHYLVGLKGVSNNTIKSYRDTFTIFLPFAADCHSIKVDSLKVEHLSTDLITTFLSHIEKERNVTPKTRNLRLAAFKSMAKYLRLMHPDQRKVAEKILNIPQKRTQKRLIGFMSFDEVMKVLNSVKLNKQNGFRDYTILHLLYDSGARASEIAALEIDSLDPQNQTLSILGKGNRFRRIELWPKTTELLKLYIKKYRNRPKELYKNRIFINQRGGELTRQGIHNICKKYLAAALPQKKVKELSPAHSFRHSCAMNMLTSGDDITKIKNRLGHVNIQSTMTYLHLNLPGKREVQERFIKYTESIITNDPKIDELIDWESKEDILTWLDSL